MIRRPTRVVNTKTAVRCIVYPIDGLKEREPDQLMSEVLEEKAPPKKRAPGVALLIKLDKQRKKEKQKKVEERMKARESNIDAGAVDEAMARIMANMTC